MNPQIRFIVFKLKVKAYKRILTEKKTWIGKRTEKVYMFSLIYLDNDSVPELFVYEHSTYAEGKYKIYTYYKGKAQALELPMGDESWYDRTNDVCSKYYKKTGFFVSDWAKQGGASLSYDYYPGKGKKVKRICSKSWAVGNEKQASYSAGYESSTQKEYNRLIKKYSKGKKPTKVKWYENTAKNRKKYLK